MEHNNKIERGLFRDVTWRGLVGTWRLIRDWSYVLTFRLISKYRGESDLDLCLTMGLEKRMPLHSGDFRFQNIFGRKICWKLPVQSGILFASPDVTHRPCGASIQLSPTFRHWERVTVLLKMQSLGICFPQQCSSAGRRFAASRSRSNYSKKIGSFPHKRIRQSALLDSSECTLSF